MINVSMRSHLIAGAAAIVGTSAIALAPVVQPTLAIRRHSGFRRGAGCVRQPGHRTDRHRCAVEQPAHLVFPRHGRRRRRVPTGRTPGPPPSRPASATLSTRRCGTRPRWVYYSYVGLIPQLINDPAPSLQQLGVNLIGYVSDGIYRTGRNGQVDQRRRVGSAFSVARRDSAADLRGFPRCAGTLTTAVVGPITDAINNATTGIQGIVGSVDHQRNRRARRGAAARADSCRQLGGRRAGRSRTRRWRSSTTS